MALFTKLPIDKSQIEQAIEAFELQSSAELRVYIERNMPKNSNVFDRTLAIFHQLEMHQTEKRNAVLIYIAFKAHSCCVIGDQGIHQYVGDHFWQQVHQQMIADFKQEIYNEGIIRAIETIGRELALHFPHQQNDKNELPNEVIIRD